MMLNPNELQFINDAIILVGIDEAGAGTLAGDLVVAGCILPTEHGITGLNDSKKLTEQERERLYDLITEQALAFHIERISPEDIDKSNIFACRMNGMRRCAEQLSAATHIIVDGDKVPHNMPKPTLAIVKADDKLDCVRAASILAKVDHDRQLIKQGAQFPHFQFDKHKGYATKLHKEMLSLHGPTHLHRKSFKPVMEAQRQFTHAEPVSDNGRHETPSDLHTDINHEGCDVQPDGDDFSFHF